MPKANTSVIAESLREAIGKLPRYEGKKQAVLKEAIAIVNEYLVDYPVTGLVAAAHGATSQMDALRRMATAYGGLLPVTPAAKALVRLELTKSSVEVIRSGIWTKMDNHVDWTYHDAGVFRYIPFMTGGSPRESVDGLSPEDRERYLVGVITGSPSVIAAAERIADVENGHVKTSEMAAAALKAGVTKSANLRVARATVHNALMRECEKGRWERSEPGVFRRMHTRETAIQPCLPGLEQMQFSCPALTKTEYPMNGARLCPTASRQRDSRCPDHSAQRGCNTRRPRREARPGEASSASTRIGTPPTE